VAGIVSAAAFLCLFADSCVHRCRVSCCVQRHQTRAIAIRYRLESHPAFPLARISTDPVIGSAALQLHTRRDKGDNQHDQ
jgi:hypothetical protein